MGASLAYQQTAGFIFNAGSAPFLLALTGSNFLGTGFDSALFRVYDNGNLLLDKSFSDLIAAQVFFSNDLLSFQLGTGLNDIQVSLDEMMSGGEGFSFKYATTSVSNTPVPNSFVLFGSCLVAGWLMVYRRRSSNSMNSSRVAA